MAQLIGKRSNEGKNNKIYTKLCFVMDWDEQTGKAEGNDCLSVTTTMDCKHLIIGEEYTVMFKPGFEGKAVFAGCIPA